MIPDLDLEKLGTLLMEAFQREINYGEGSPVASWIAAARAARAHLAAGRDREEERIWIDDQIARWMPTASCRVSTVAKILDRYCPVPEAKEWEPIEAAVEVLGPSWRKSEVENVFDNWDALAPLRARWKETR